MSDTAWEIRAAPGIRLLWVCGNTLITVVDDAQPTTREPLSPFRRALLIATLEHALTELKHEETSS